MVRGERSSRDPGDLPLWTLCAADYSGMEGWKMNEFGEPNMGNPSVRFDEGREMFWSLACRPLNPASLAYSTTLNFSKK